MCPCRIFQACIDPTGMLLCHMALGCASKQGQCSISTTNMLASLWLAGADPGGPHVP